METRYILSKLSSKTSEASDDSFESADNNILAKIKRLQIEENYICQSMRKTIKNSGICLENVFSNDSDYHKFKTKIKDSYMSVKNLFDYVNANISDQAALKSVDVDEIKMAILELEDKIKSLKKYLHSELINLKRTEEELIRNNENSYNKITGRQKIHSVTYNHIVPSPVKEMINSSFKCSEVQEFQEFMTNSENRYGGWNEYYHNIFVRSWNKYIQVNCNINLESYKTNVIDSDSFQLLINELLQRLPGFTKENLLLHCKWYIKYTYLKERQSLAIEKWREKKLLIKKKTIERKEKNTAQEITKYQSNSNSAENTTNLSSSRHWRIPNWRSGLQEL
ncbi:coiled-coil domain-containing protein 112 isoform X2 [Manduca sexta]|uniref:coiled-coil domain-containing protein 112 isoform X2 n=1 Tax=Manduca sexta TaxID=7130 RepID=UPI00188FB3ED|nr:coiled-coil domain-containing protein 112 isoform X2 [Manduca sexta]